MAKTVLVADDDPAIVDALAELFDDEGFDVVQTLDGAVAEVASQHQPDIILLDVWMSGHDGGQICSELKRLPATRHIPVMLMSANREVGQIARDCGADDYVSKPFDVDELLGKVDVLAG